RHPFPVEGIRLELRLVQEPRPHVPGGRARHPAQVRRDLLRRGRQSGDRAGSRLGVGLLINFRRWFDLYVNLRPVRLFEGLPCPLAGRKPGDIDYMVIRENTEGEYGNVGGRYKEGTPDEVVMQQSVFSRKGVDRI